MRRFLMIVLAGLVSGGVARADLMYQFGTGGVPGTSSFELNIYESPTATIQVFLTATNGELSFPNLLITSGVTLTYDPSVAKVPEAQTAGNFDHVNLGTQAAGVFGDWDPPEGDLVTSNSASIFPASFWGLEAQDPLDPQYSSLQYVLLGEFTFTATGVGTTVLTAAVPDTPSTMILDQNGDPVDLDAFIASATGSIRVIPEPGTLIVLMTGLIGVGGYRRWRSRRIPVA